MASNPEHIALEIRSPEKRIAAGTEIAFEERVAGIRGSAAGTVTNLTPGVAATWEGVAEYRCAGFRMSIEEGVTWSVEPTATGSKLSAHVWARFPSGWLGPLLEWYSTAILRIVHRDREHARCELEYLKRLFEGGGRSANAGP